MNYFKCCYCGKFISYQELEEEKIGKEYTWDSDYSCEDEVFWHKTCEKKYENR